MTDPNNITHAFPNWPALSTLERAQAVIDWTQAQGVDTSSITARGLVAAMNLQPSQDAISHHEMIITIAAYLAAR